MSKLGKVEIIDKVFKASLDKGKGVLGASPGFPLQVPLNDDVGKMDLMKDMGSRASRVGSSESTNRASKIKCPRFDGSDFNGWWSKMKQYFEGE